ncbi:MAG: zinc-dependent metalloprotease [Deltaproteobacteria bacterium]|jgi:hypothetical protein
MLGKATLRSLVAVLALGGVLAGGFLGCGTPQTPVSQLGANIIDKSIFQGSWYMSQTIIDFDYEGAGLGFVGEVGNDGTSGGYAVPRIRWVIDEQTLYAFRDYQTVGDAVDPFEDERQNDPRFIGQPVAAYRIQSHFDIRRQYNTVTGEELNVLSENTVDRRWWERQFMRVDFSRNLLASRAGISADLRALFGELRREPADLTVWSQSDMPREWMPQFNYMSCASADGSGCSEGDRIYAGDYAQGDLYHMSFVNLELLSPGVVFIPGLGPVPYCGEPAVGLPTCASVPIAVRTSFLRVSDTREYQAQQWQDEMFERAGYFRLERDTFDTTHHADDVSWGTTDFRNYAGFRHNMWQDWYTDEVLAGSSCTVAPDCFEAAGPEARCRGGQCVRRTPVPYADRGVRRITWHTSPELPAHLVRPAFETANEWNRIYMQVVRTRQGQPLPEYPAVDCQRTNPDDYCYCTDVPVAGAPGCDLNNPDTWAMCETRTINPTCDGQYNPFQSPADAAAAGVVAPFDCYVQVPGGAEPDVNDTELMARLEDRNYEGWFGAQMVGSECVLELRVNSCNIAAVRDNTLNPGTTEGLDCQLRGDMRFSLLSYVDQPGTPFLGVAQFRADPVTGEVLSTDANIGGPALQSVRTRAMQAFDLINGRFTDQEFFTGEDIRAYLEAANRVDLPAPPRIDFSVATGVPGLAASADPGVRAEIQRTMDRAAARAEALQGPEGRTRIYSDRLSTLRGSDLEQRLFDNDEIFVLAGMANLPEHGSPSALRASLLDQVSPLGGGLERRIQESLAEETAMNAAGMHMVNEFTDDSVLWFVNQHRDWPRARVEFELNRRLYRQTEIHEMGHCLGLRHDFGASADTENYAPQYYRIAEQFPLPDPRDFETDGTPGYSVAESNAFERAYSGARRLRELAGIDAWMNSAIMEYTANWYQRIQGSGYQDWMAIALGYGGLVDIYHNEAGRPVDEVNSATTPRVYVQHYMGGELCSTDNDCPYSTGGSRSAELTEANRASGLTQSCIPNRSRAGQNVCSSFESDSSELRARVEDGAASAEWVPIYYRYCEDYRAGTRSLAWCNTFDEGDSYREVVRNSMEAYERMYIFRAFRRYRRLFGYNYADGVLRYLFPVVNIQQNLLYNYANNPEFRDTEGPFGFYDQFLSSADGLNFFARILGSPGVGAYNYNTGYRRYVRTNQDPAAPGADLAVPLGMGRFPYSVYQSGLTGLDRVERIGAIIDKIYTMLLMTSRGLSPWYGTDEAFYTNWYDLFPTEIDQMFRGMIGDQPDQYMPRVVCGSGSFPDCNNPRIVYMDFYRGDCETPGSTTCRPNPADVTYRDLNVIEGGDTFLLQSYAAIFGLAQFPVYYDTTFQTQLFMCIEGRGDCPQVDPSSVEGVDYVRHTSNRFFQSYLAWQLTPGTGAEQESVAFAMVREAQRSALIVQTFREYRGDFGGRAFNQANITRRAEFDALGIPIPAQDVVSREINRLDGRVTDLESFFNYLIQIQRSYGINPPAIFTRPEL